MFYTNLSEAESGKRLHSVIYAMFQKHKLFVTNEHGQIIWVTRKFADRCGLTPEELLTISLGPPHQPRKGVLRFGGKRPSAAKQQPVGVCFFRIPPGGISFPDDE